MPLSSIKIDIVIVGQNYKKKVRLGLNIKAEV